MTQDTGASAGGPGSREPDPSVPALTGVDPSRIPPVDEWERRINCAVAMGAVEMPDGTHRYIRNAMRCLLGNFASPVELLDRHCRAWTAGDVKEIEATRRELAQYEICDAALSDSDGSGEASETRSGSTEGDSAGPKDIAQEPSP